MFKLETMKEISTFFKNPLDQNDILAPPILLIGLDQSLLPTLPKGSYIIDSSFSKIKNIENSNFLFETKHLPTFTLNKKFLNILSLNCLHLEENLEQILLRIYHHLINEAILYFPLAPNESIEKYLQDMGLIKQNCSAKFQYRTRTDVEIATLQVPFNSILIEEKNEISTFYSKEQLNLYLLEIIPTISTLEEQTLKQTAKDLTNKLYKEEDKILTLSSPWILLTLSCEETLI
jgi:hypothetical protein